MLRQLKAFKRILIAIPLILLMAVSSLVLAQPRSGAQVKSCPGNLVNNGNFGSGLTGWSPPAYGTPDLSTGIGALDPGAVGMWGNMNSSLGEGLKQTLSLVSGKVYVGSIWFKRANDPNKQPYAKFRLRATTTVQSQWGLPGTIYVSPIITSTTWAQYNFTFIAPGNVTVLTINVENNLSAYDGRQTSYGQVDNICIREAPSLPCCECLGQVTTLNLSTGQGSPIDPFWTVNGGPAYTTPPYPGWTTSLTLPARWIQPVASPTPASNVPPGSHDYRVQFNIPECAIRSDVRLEVKWAADNSGKVFLDNNPTAVASCALNTCFQTGVAQSFSLTNLGAGSHTLRFEVNNIGGPSGLIVDAKLTRRCVRENPGPAGLPTMERN